MSLARVLQTLKIKYPIRDQLLWRPIVPGWADPMLLCEGRGSVAFNAWKGGFERAFIGGRGERRLHAHFPD